MCVENHVESTGKVFTIFFFFTLLSQFYSK